jgi:hypothetical protein
MSGLHFLRDFCINILTNSACYSSGNGAIDPLVHTICMGYGVDDVMVIVNALLGRRGSWRYGRISDDIAAALEHD